MMSWNGDNPCTLNPTSWTQKSVMNVPVSITVTMVPISTCTQKELQISWIGDNPYTLNPKP